MVRTVISNVAYTLAVLACGTKTDTMGMSRLYAIQVHNHIPGGDAERGVCSEDFACGGGPLLPVLPGKRAIWFALVMGWRFYDV